MEEEDHYTYLLLLLFAVSLVQVSSLKFAVGGEERRGEREREEQEKSGVVLVVWYCTRKKEKINKEDLT